MIGHRERKVGRLLLTLVIALGSSIARPAPVFEVLHGFGTPGCGASGTDGVMPTGGLLLHTDGLLYGTTGSGPYDRGGLAPGNGSIFTLDPRTKNFTSKLVFTRDSGGQWPSGGLTPHAGSRFHGTTNGSSQAGSLGTIFEYEAPSGLRIIYTFSPPFDRYAGTANADGAYPHGVVAYRDGSLWGLTEMGGPGGTGTVFRADPVSGEFAVIHAFDPLPLSEPPSNMTGANPNGLLALGGDGNYYGVARNGGPAWTGTLFKVDPRDSSFEVVHAFTAIDVENRNVEGAYPKVGLTVGRDGALYGATCHGGPQGGGTVFRYSTSARSLTVVHAFAGTQSCPSSEVLQASDGNFYGTTLGDVGTPVIYRITPAGSFSVLHTFDAPFRDPLCGLDYTNEEGMRATGRLIEDSSGNLYGTAESGGLGHAGTAFVLRGAIEKGSGAGSGGSGEGSSGGGGSTLPLELFALAALLLRRRKPQGH